ncbi:MAG: TonB-dependent receptor [Syntrophothermus sp.]
MNKIYRNNSSKVIAKITIVLFFLLVTQNLFAGTTGKLTGKVIDATTNEPVIGANVIIEGTYYGAAADINGNFTISSIPPGEYRVIASSIGYQTVITEKVLIKIDLTTRLEIKLSQTAVSVSKEIVVTAERSLVQKDLTNTSATITANDIKMMPVEEVGQIINLQAGVQRAADGGFHFRGGRSNEVSFLIDGIPVTDAFNGGIGVEINNSTIRQMEIISGTFNAEYGQAMSGVVNIVTQEGSPTRISGNVSGYVGSYFTPHKDIFQNLDLFDNFNSVNAIPTNNLQFSLDGPLGISNLTFFVTGRYFENKGYLYGRRDYNVWDDVPFYPIPNDNTIWIPRNTGDGKYVSMNPERRYSFNGKVTYSLPEVKLSYSYFFDDGFNKYYDHNFSRTPDGTLNHYRNNYIHNLQVSHYPSQSTLQTLKFSSNLYKYKGYLYKDPYDSRYVDPQQGIALTNYTFRSGGNAGNRYDRSTLTYITQYQLSSQITDEHKIGVGVEAKIHKIFNQFSNMYNATDGVLDSIGNKIFTLAYMPLGTLQHQAYTKKPLELSGYVQDKMEYDIMIINAGVRFDYFDPNSSLPFDLKNPSGNPNFPGYNQLRKADPKFQVSPRIGASFPITDQGILRFSYGHFFQIPNFENLYTNSDYLINPGQSLSSVMGNPDLKAQKTVMYEIGLQQVLFTNFVLNFSLYYRDIRNLLGMEIVNTYEGFKYGRFINRDYGNVRGFLVTLDKRFADYFSAKIDYTYQIAEGNASDPYSAYNNNQTNPPIEEPKTVVPLDWDQRSTLNLSVNVGDPGDWIVGFVFQYGSGWPYTEDVKVSKGVRFENGGVKPPTYNLDLRVEKVFDVAGINVNTFLLVYNLLDIKNEYGVYSTTGRANVDLNTKYAGEIVGLNTIQEYINNPGMYSAPREIRLGFGFGF